MKNNQALPVIGAQRMTSLEIAEVTGKQHYHLMRDIRNMELEQEKLAAQAPRALKLLVTEREILKQGDSIRRQQIEMENAPADGCLTVTDIVKTYWMTDVSGMDSTWM